MTRVISTPRTQARFSAAGGSALVMLADETETVAVLDQLKLLGCPAVAARSVEAVEMMPNSFHVRGILVDARLIALGHDLLGRLKQRFGGPPGGPRIVIVNRPLDCARPGAAASRRRPAALFVDTLPVAARDRPAPRPMHPTTP